MFRIRITYVKVFALVLAFVSTVGNSAQAPGLNNQVSLRYKIAIPPDVSRSQVRVVTQKLANLGFDIAGIDLDGGKIEVIATDTGVAALNKLGFKGTIVGRSDESAPDRRFLNPDSLKNAMTEIATANPQIARLAELGRTNQGRPVLGMLISNTLDVNSSQYFSKPTIIFDGLHHAREIMTPEIVLDVAATLIKNSRRKLVSDILKNWNVWVIPMVNPDGSNIVWTSNSMWRKNARAGMTSIYGVDINRNYAYRWAECRGSSGNTSADDYRGSAVGSEPETQAMMKLADMTHPTASLSYHSYSELVLYPYGCQGDYTGERQLVQQIAGELASRLPKDSGRGQYTPGTPWELLYSVDGSSMDYMYAAHGALAYTFEVNTDFHPNYALREPTLAKHRAAWMYFINRISNSLLTVNVIDGKTGQPAEAVINVSTIKLNKKELPLRTNRYGKFFKVLAPGAYQLEVKLRDGRGTMLNLNMQNAPQALLATVP